MLICRAALKLYTCLMSSQHALKFSKLKNKIIDIFYINHFYFNFFNCVFLPSQNYYVYNFSFVNILVYQYLLFNIRLLYIIVPTPVVVWVFFFQNTMHSYVKCKLCFILKFIKNFDSIYFLELTLNTYDRFAC